MHASADMHGLLGGASLIMQCGAKCKEAGRPMVDAMPYALCHLCQVHFTLAHAWLQDQMKLLGSLGHVAIFLHTFGLTWLHVCLDVTQ